MVVLNTAIVLSLNFTCHCINFKGMTELINAYSPFRAAFLAEPTQVHCCPSEKNRPHRGDKFPEDLVGLKVRKDISESQDIIPH